MLRGLLNGLTDIVWPKICLSCKNKLDKSAVHDFICDKCWNSIKRNIPPFCKSCGRRLEKSNIAKNICPSCIRKNLYFDAAFSPCVYTGVLKELIHEFKYKNKDYLGYPLSKLMVRFIKEYNMPIDFVDFIVPVPLHKSKLREREFNQAEVLSTHIAKEFKKNLLSDALLRTRSTKTQADLEISERILNVKDSFAVSKQDDVRKKNILLIDDVLTTGATTSEASLALKRAGANIVFVLTLAS